MNTRRASSTGSRAALALALILIAGACTTAVGGRAGALQSTLPNAGAIQRNNAVVTLNVTNRGWSNVVVYLADGTTPRRLGSVAPLKETQLSFYRGSGPLRILLRPLGSNEGFVPEPVWVDVGSLVELTVHPLLKTSELIVR